MESHTLFRMSLYRYTALQKTGKEIRLLILHPGDFHDVIRVSITHTSLIVPPAPTSQRLSLAELKETVPNGWDIYETVEGRYVFESEDSVSWTHPDPNFSPSLYIRSLEYPPAQYEPRYEALSYTWGSSENSENIRVESDRGSDDIHILPARPNLAITLRHLRLQDRSRIMWIDSICIDQSSIVERSEQVQRMADIYRLAARVVVWLGEATADSHLAISALRYLGKQLEITTAEYRIRSPDATEMDYYAARCKMPYGKETWDAISSLLGRPWFERVWIVQEIQLSNSKASLMCGQMEIPWRYFRRAVNALARKVDLPSGEIMWRLTNVHTLTYRQNTWSFIDLVNYNKDRQCTDPRDRVYGMPGLAPKKIAQTLIPNYALGIADVYQSALLADVQYSKRLEFLRFCDSTARTFEGPSWIPDWSLHTKFPGLLPQYPAGVSCARTECVSPNVLRVSGLICGTICEASKKLSQTSEAILADIRGMGLENHQGTTYITGESLIQAYALTICANNVKERWSKQPVSSIKQRTETLLSAISHCEFVDEQETRPILQTTMEFTAPCKGRRFMSLDGGCIGLGPAGAQPGTFLYQPCHGLST